MPLPGDTFLRRRLCEATPLPGDAPSGQPVDFLSLLWALERSHHVLTLTLTFGQRPGTGRYRFMLGFEEDWIIEKLIHVKFGFLFWFNCVYYKTLFSLAYPYFFCCIVNCDDCTMYTSKWSFRYRRLWRILRYCFKPYIINIYIFISRNRNILKNFKFL